MLKKTFSCTGELKERRRGFEPAYSGRQAGGHGEVRGDCDQSIRRGHRPHQRCRAWSAFSSAVFTDE